METSNPRAMVVEMREAAGVSRIEIERRIGYRKDSLRDFERRTGPMSEKDQKTLLRYLQALCEVEGCDFPGRMRRLRSAKGLASHSAGRAIGCDNGKLWRRVERGGKSNYIFPDVRQRLNALLNKWHAEMGDGAGTAE